MKEQPRYKPSREFLIAMDRLLLLYGDKDTNWIPYERNNDEWFIIQLLHRN